MAKYTVARIEAKRLTYETGNCAYYGPWWFQIFGAIIPNMILAAALSVPGLLLAFVGWLLRILS